MKKIFTFLAAVLFVGLFSAQAQETVVKQSVKFQPKTYDSATKKYVNTYDPFTSDIIRNADGSYTILDFFASDDMETKVPLTFSFPAEIGKYTDVTFSGNIYAEDYEDEGETYTSYYLMTEDGEDYAELMTYDSETGDEVPIYWPEVYPDGYSYAYTYDTEDEDFDPTTDKNLYVRICMGGFDANDKYLPYIYVDFFFDAMEIPAVEAKDYFLVGGFNSWNAKDEATKFTLADDGTYTFDYEGDFAGEFVITNGTWDEKYASNGEALKLGEPYELKLGAGNIQLNVAGVKDPHFVFDPTASTLTVTGEAIDAKASYAVKGDIFGVASWSTEEMTEEDGKWVLTKDVVKGGFIIVKFLEGFTEEQGWIKSTAEGGAVTLNSWMDVTDNGGSDFSLNIAEGGVYTFTFDPEAMTLAVNAGSGVTGVAADDKAPVEYFNLQGIRVDNPENGIFVRRQGSKVQKVVR